MTWREDHPGGVITCDAPGCTRSRHEYCSPTESGAWRSDVNVSTLSVRDFCPEHNTWPRDVETAPAQTHSAFEAYLNERLQEPAFRAAYEDKSAVHERKEHDK